MEIKYLEKLFKIQQDDAKLWGKNILIILILKKLFRNIVKTKRLIGLIILGSIIK